MQYVGEYSMCDNTYEHAGCIQYAGEYDISYRNRHMWAITMWCHT